MSLHVFIDPFDGDCRMKENLRVDDLKIIYMPNMFPLKFLLADKRARVTRKIS